MANMTRMQALPDREGLWIDDPLSQRQVVAKTYVGMPLASLGLSLRAYNLVHRGNRYADVAALIMAGPDIWQIRGMRLESMRSIHASLAPLLANGGGFVVRGAAEVHAIPKQWLQLLREIEARDDLAGLSLERLGLTQASFPWLPQPLAGTVGQLDPEIARRWWIASAPVAAHQERLTTWALSVAQVPIPIDEDGLLQHWLHCGIQVVPTSTIRPDQALEPLLVQLLREQVVARRGEVDWEIVRHRSGLGDAKGMTLQELGQALGLTRERIRQRESKAHLSIRYWWSNLDQLYQPKVLHPALQEAVTRLRDLIQMVLSAPVDEAAFARQSQPILRNSGPGLSPLVRLLADMEGLKRFDLGSDTKVVLWGHKDRQDFPRLVAGIRALHKVITSSAGAFSTLELVLAVQRSQAFDPPVQVDDIRAWVRLCSSVELLPDGRYQGRLAHLASRPLQAQRMLADAGHPLHLNDLVRTLNAHLALAGERQVAKLNLSNQLTQDRQLVPIGRSGYWALSTWENVERDTVLKLVIRCLEQHDYAMTSDEIFAWVKDRRPVSLASIHFYLVDDSRFGRFDRERWGLAAWRELREAKPWDRQAVAAFVKQTIQAQGHRQLPYATLRDALAHAADVSERTATGMLASNPAIETVPGSDGQLLARLRTGAESGQKDANEATSRRGVRNSLQSPQNINLKSPVNISENVRCRTGGQAGRAGRAGGRKGHGAPGLLGGLTGSRDRGGRRGVSP